MRLFETALDDTGGRFTIASDQLTADNGRTDGLCGIDNFFDTRYTEGNVHGRDTGEVERLQRHLCSGLTDRLCANGTDC